MAPYNIKTKINTPNKTVILLFFFACLFQRCYAEEIKTTIWIGESKDEFSFEYHSILLENLKINKNLEFRTYEYGRALSDYNSSKSTCLFNRRISSIFKDAKYSSPISKYASRQLFFRPETHHSIERITDATGLVDLEKLFLTYPDRVLLVGNGLTYGDKLDATIKKLDTKNLYFRVPSGHLGAFIKMLMQKRVDYIIEYQISFNHIQLDTSKYSSLKISSDEYTTGHLVCNKETPDQVIKLYEEAIKIKQPEITQIKMKFNMLI